MFEDNKVCSLLNRYRVELESDLMLDKVYTKRFIEEVAVLNTPKTLKYYSKPETPNLSTDIYDDLPEHFVQKSIKRAGGHGTYVLRKDGKLLIEPTGNRYTRGEMLDNMWKGYLKIHSDDQNGTVFEEKIVSHSDLCSLSHFNEFIELRFYFLHGQLFDCVISSQSTKSVKERYTSTVNKNFFFVVDGVISPTIYFAIDNTINGDCLNGFKIPNWDKMVDQISIIPKLFRTQFLVVDGTLDQKGEFIFTEMCSTPNLSRLTETGVRLFKSFNTNLSAGESVAERWMKKPRCWDCAKLIDEGEYLCYSCQERRKLHGSEEGTSRRKS